MNELLIFAAQAMLIYLLGIQQMNVTGKHYIAAAITSVLLGLCGWTVTSMIAEVRLAGMYSWLFLFYLVAGPMGIILALATHGRVLRIIYGGRL